MSKQLPYNKSFVSAARAINGKPTEYRIEGVPGLVLMCQTSGTATYYLTYAAGQSRRRLKLGRRGEMNLAEARLAALEASTSVGKGSDPVADAHAMRSAMTFSDLVDAFMAAPDGPTKATKENYQFGITKDVLPALGNVPVVEITADMVADVLDSIEARGSIVQADRTRAAVSSLLTWGIKSRRAKGLRVNVVRTLPTRAVTKPRSRGISAIELNSIWNSLDGVTELVAIAVKIAWLTACRRTEVVGARTEELDLENARWCIPGDGVRKGRLVEGRTKSGREKIVPLSTQVVALFRRAADLSTARDLDTTRAVFLFPALVAGGKYPHIAPLSVTTAIRRLRADAGIDDVRLHDGRAAARTWLRDQGYADNILDAVLGHAGSSVGERHYTASSLVFIERHLRPALQSWADHVEAITAAKSDKK